MDKRELHRKMRGALQLLGTRGAHSADLVRLPRSNLTDVRSILYEMLKNDEAIVRNGMWTWRDRRSVKRLAA